MTTFEKLAKRIKDELNIEVNPASLKRTYAGYWQKAAGAFVWKGYVYGSSHQKTIGSIESATKLLKEKRLVVVEESFNEIEIIGEKE